MNRQDVKVTHEWKTACLTKEKLNSQETTVPWQCQTQHIYCSKDRVN